MSLCKLFGKDRVILVTAEDHQKPSTVQLAELDSKYTPKGLILPNGDINWSCPCLGGMASGPCGFFFRQAFSCFHTSKAEPKGSDCIDNFVRMQECMQKYPNLYPQGKESEAMSSLANESNASTATTSPTTSPAN